MTTIRNIVINSVAFNTYFAKDDRKDRYEEVKHYYVDGKFVTAKEFNDALKIACGQDGLDLLVDELLMVGSRYKYCTKCKKSHEEHLKVKP